jgi:hypothetical protein
MAKRGLSPAKYKALCKQVYTRDRWQCRNPECKKRNSLHAHHIEFRSAGGPDTTANMVTLCGGPGSCHDRIHVEGTLLILAKSGKPEDTPDANVGLRFISK